METRTAGIKLSVLQLMSGDLFYHHMAGYHLFVCRGQHPIWPELQAVVWCDSDGKLTIDALSPRQMLEGVVVNRGETPSQRSFRFRQWYLERAH